MKGNSRVSGKLIATVLSIVTCVAVMGVGVWAASTDFALALSNKVELVFYAKNLDVYAYSKNVGGGFFAEGYGKGAILENSDFFFDRATLDNPTAIATNGKNPVLMFSQGEYVTEESSDATNYEAFTSWQQMSGFSANTMDMSVVESSIEFVFTIKPSLAYDTTDYAFAINEKSLPTPISPTMVFSSKYEYRVSIDGSTFGEWQTIAYGTEETAGVWAGEEVDSTGALFFMNFGTEQGEAGEQKIVQIRAVCTYSNPDRRTVIVEDEWNFAVSFYVCKPYDGTQMANHSTRTDTTLEVERLFVDYGEGLELNRKVSES